MSSCSTESYNSEQLLVDEANQNLPNQSDINVLSSFINQDVYQIAYYTVSQMCSKDIDWAFHLVKTNMEQYYRQSRDMGWLDASKYKEMTEEDARYIVLILKSSQTPVGFIHCRFTIDDDLDPITHEQTQLAVIYCYEIQLDTLVQRKGLGRALMTAMESLGRLHQMQKCKLTVFKHNPTAMAFYTSIGYVVDCTSPSMHMSEKRASRVSYEIMSKRLLDT